MVQLGDVDLFEPVGCLDGVGFGLVNLCEVHVEVHAAADEYRCVSAVVFEYLERTKL